MPGLGSLMRAQIIATDNGLPIDRLAFSYNPTQVQTSKTATWRRPTTRGAQSATTPEFTGAEPQTIEMELFFDAWNDPVGDVSSSVNKLLGWTKPTALSRTRGRPSPPVLMIQWGLSQAFSDFRGYLKSAHATYTMFRVDGGPIRATCTITMEEVPTEAGPQNPTSGSPDSRRSRLLGDGDSLASVAYAEYGDASLWRGLAAFNGVDDPFSVGAGARLLVPSPAEAKRLAAKDGG
jgi:nucleoid-associated protein YgaU